jgi:hypothetical protein
MLVGAKLRQVNRSSAGPGGNTGTLSSGRRPRPGRPASASQATAALVRIVDRYRDETSAPERLLTCRQISDPDRLTAYNPTPADVVAAVQSQNIQSALGRIGAAPMPGHQQLRHNGTRRRLSAFRACIYSPYVLS